MSSEQNGSKLQSTILYSAPLSGKTLAVVFPLLHRLSLLLYVFQLINTTQRVKISYRGYDTESTSTKAKLLVSHVHNPDIPPEKVVSLYLPVFFFSYGICTNVFWLCCKNDIDVYVCLQQYLHVCHEPGEADDPRPLAPVKTLSFEVVVQRIQINQKCFGTPTLILILNNIYVCYLRSSAFPKRWDLI